MRGDTLTVSSWGWTLNMNILQMISKNDRYGAQRIFLDQVATLHRMGHSVTVVVRGKNGYVTDSVREMGLPCHGIPMKGLGDLLFLRRLIKKSNIDVIHTTLDRADYLGILLSRICRKPIVSTMMVPRCHFGYRMMDNVIVLSQKQEGILKKVLPAGRVSLVRPGIDVHRFSRPNPEKREAWIKKLNIEQYDTIFCHVSSLLSRKAHAVSLELIYELKKRGSNPLLIIIGDPLHGEYFESLVAKSVAWAIGQNISFTGWTSEIPELLSLSHMSVLPSENEALGIVLMEGMAAGTPIIARKEEGGAELIEAYQAGFVYDPDQHISDLAGQVLNLLRDSSRFHDMSRRCREAAEKEFALPQFGENLVAVYERHLKRGHC